MNTINRLPLAVGTVIEYAGMRAVVDEDLGGATLIVIVEDGARVQWRWHFDGETCRVVSPLPA